jgi:hypothetical protein
MTTVNVNFTTRKQTVPANSGATPNVLVSLMRGEQVAASGVVQLPAVSTTFTSVPDGIYVVKAQCLTGMNEPVGDAAVSEEFAVVNTVEIDVPDVVTVTLG